MTSPAERDALVKRLREYSEGMPHPWDDDRNYSEREINRLLSDRELILSAIAALTVQPSAGEPDKRMCHSPGDKCYGCDHYHGRADVCKYAPTESSLRGKP